MIFKVYSTIVLGQTQTYSQDLKLGHYMKISPRTTFARQIFATIWAAFVQIATMNWTPGAIDGVCSADQKDHFTCLNGRTFFSSNIVWGLLGGVVLLICLDLANRRLRPQRMFGPGSLYAYFNIYWLVGALLPVVFWVLIRTFKTKKLRWLHAPIMLGGMSWLPPATPLSFSSWAIVDLAFNLGIMRRFTGWWTH